jgi:hypothetical protein
MSAIQKKRFKCRVYGATATWIHIKYISQRESSQNKTDKIQTGEINP